MTVQLARRLLTIQEYYLMAEVGILKPDDKVELIKGEIFTMSPIGKRHAYTVDELTEMLIIKLRGLAVIRNQNPITIENHSEPEPDIAVAKLPKETYRDQRHPAPSDIFFLIEVSDSTLNFDQTKKLPVYAEADIAEVWLVNLNEEEIEVYKQPQGGKYKQLSTYQAGERIPLTGFDQELAVDDILGR